METYDAHGLPPRRIGTKIKSTCRTAGALYGGKRGIRTLEGFRGPTRFPVVRLRPAQPSFQGSRLTAWAIIASCAGVVKRLLQYFFRFFGSRNQNPCRPAFWKGKYPPVPAAAGRKKRKKAPRRTGPEGALTGTNDQSAAVLLSCRTKPPSSSGVDIPCERALARMAA